MKKLIALAVLLALALTVVGCAQKPDEAFDQQLLCERAREDIAVINTLDFEAASALMREDLRAQLPAAQLEAAIGPRLQELGPFSELGKQVLTGSTSKSTGEPYATVQTICEYENGQAVYTLTYDLEYELVGLYLK